MKYRILAILLTLYTEIGVADCTNGNIAPSTDDGAALTLNNDGTVADSSTGLLWMACSLGQTWDTTSKKCTGGATLLAWDKALSITAANFSFAGFSDWRLPNINELRSIVEDCRSDPAINTNLFPMDPHLVSNVKFWSSSTYATMPNTAWLVDFGQGRDNFELKSKTNTIRLVRVK